MVRPQVVWEPCTWCPQRYGVVVRLLVLCATSWRLNGTKKNRQKCFSHLLKISLYVSFPKLFAVLGSFKTVTAVSLHRVSRIPEGKSFQQPCWSMNKHIQYEVAPVYVPVSESPETLYHKNVGLCSTVHCEMIKNLTVGQLYTLNCELWLAPSARPDLCALTRFPLLSRVLHQSTNTWKLVTHLYPMCWHTLQGTEADCMHCCQPIQVLSGLVICARWCIQGCY